MNARQVLVACAVAVPLVTAGRTASAATACSSLPNPIVVESGDTQEPLLKALGQKLRNASTPMTILYKLAGSCTLIDDVYTNNRPIAQNAVLNYAPSSTEDPMWDPSKASATCTVDQTDGLPVDVAISATFVSSCTTNPPRAGVGTVDGPKQGYAFIVPKASSQTVITAEEGYFTFGFGNTGQAAPWTDELYMFTRPPTKSTALTLAAAIGVPAAKLKGQPQNASTDVLTRVATSSDPEKTIGLLGSEVYDANRGKVTELAFRAFGQKHGYLPDSSATSFDKRNLRDGHYTPWAPTVYITAVDGNGTPTNKRAKALIDLVMGDPAAEITDVDGLATVISKGLIPDCAMKVTRAFEGGQLSIYSPAEPCGCYYEKTVPQGATSCTVCSDDSPCGGGKCRHGYCEAK